MKSIRNKTKPLFWLALICIPLWGFGLQAQNVSAYQNDGSISANLASVPILKGEYETDEVLIRFDESAANETIQGCLLSAGATALSSIEEIRVWVVQIPFGKVAESIAILSACPGVRYAEPNYIAFVADTIPSDSDWELQYGLINIHAPQGWDYSSGSSTVTIAIIDSGVDLNHPDLADKIVSGYDFVNNDAIAQDDFGHGTHVAGIAAASGNDGIGVAGVSWGARIMPVKVLSATGNGSFADVAAGITWAADNGAQVINLSLGGTSPSAVLEDAVNYAYGKGVVLVAAAGNTGSNIVLYPARYPNVIAVGAVDSTNSQASFSNYGPELSVVAPGDSIYSTVIGGYGYKDGTSMASAYVSGLAAILRGYPGGYSPANITLALESSALDLGVPGFDSSYGHGLIQMDAALQSVYITSTPIPTPTNTFSVSSITRANPSPSSTAQVAYTVTFSESINRVSSSDFSLTTSGLTGASVSGVNGSGSVYTITIDSGIGNGNGTIRLDVPNTTTITDLSGNSLINLPYTTGEVYDVQKSLAFNSSAAQDGWILESTETSGVGGTMNSAAATFNLGDATANRQYRALLHFDTALLPDNAVITSATLKIKKRGQSGTNPFTILGGLKVEMRKPSFGTAPLALSDFKSTVGKKNVATFSLTPVSNWYSALMNNVGNVYVNRTGTTQFRLYFATDDNNDNGNDFMKFFSGNAPAASRPQLIIEYYVP